MEEYIADENGHIDAPGVNALYPPGTRVFFVNGEYAGHETPIAEMTPATLQGKETPVIQEGDVLDG